MEADKQKALLQETFKEWMEENRPNGGGGYEVSTPMTTEEVREQLQTIIYCKDDDVAELLYDNHYTRRFFGDHVAWVAYNQG